MSLLVWLPLNGNLDNYGISNTTITNVPSETEFIDGKLGKCLSLPSYTSGNNSINVKIPDMAEILANGKSYTLACWVKLTNNVVNGWVIRFGNNNCGLWWANSTARWVWNENDNGKRCANPTISGDYDNWHHLVTTVDKTVPNQITAYHYVDGLPAESYESHTWDCSSHDQPTGTLMCIFPYVSYLNDVRLYDHVLSPKEVKELSKGLVCHYPLDELVGRENLFKLDSVTPVAIAAYSREIDKNKIHLIATNGRYIDFGGNTMDFVAGTTYTVSCHVKAYSKDPNWSPRLTIRQITTNLIKSSVSLSSSLNEDNLVLTYTPTETFTGYVSGIITGSSEASAEAEYSNVKCEIGSTVTPYLPAPTDALYTTMGYGSNVVYDTSGYKNNGTMSNVSVGVDSPRYDSCILYDKSNSFITLPAFFSENSQVKEITTTIWFKTNTLNSTSPNLISLNENKFLRIRINSATIIWQYTYYASGNSSTTYTCNTLTDNNWHMYAYTFKNGIETVYIDGVQVGTTDNTSKGIYLLVGENRTWCLGAYNTPTAEKLMGSLSDFRLYSTALSADDIMELYKSPISIDNMGNIYCSDFKED